MVKPMVSLGPQVFEAAWPTKQRNGLFNWFDPASPNMCAFSDYYSAQILNAASIVGENSVFLSPKWIRILGNLLTSDLVACPMRVSLLKLYRTLLPSLRPSQLDIRGQLEAGQGPLSALLELIHRGVTKQAVYVEDALLATRALLAAEDNDWNDLFTDVIQTKCTHSELVKTSLSPQVLALLYVLAGHTLDRGLTKTGGSGHAFFSSAKGVAGSMSGVEGTMDAYRLYYTRLAPLFRYVVAQASAPLPAGPNNQPLANITRPLDAKTIPEGSSGSSFVSATSDPSQPVVAAPIASTVVPATPEAAWEAMGASVNVLAPVLKSLVLKLKNSGFSPRQAQYMLLKNTGLLPAPGTAKIDHLVISGPAGQISTDPRVIFQKHSISSSRRFVFKMVSGQSLDMRFREPVLICTVKLALKPSLGGKLKTFHLMKSDDFKTWHMVQEFMRPPVGQISSKSFQVSVSGPVAEAMTAACYWRIVCASCAGPFVCVKTLQFLGVRQAQASDWTTPPSAEEETGATTMGSATSSSHAAAQKLLDQAQWKTFLRRFRHKDGFVVPKHAKPKSLYPSLRHTLNRSGKPNKAADRSVFDPKKDVAAMIENMSALLSIYGFVDETSVPPRHAPSQLAFHLLRLRQLTGVRSRAEVGETERKSEANESLNESNVSLNDSLNMSLDAEVDVDASAQDNARVTPPADDQADPSAAGASKASSSLSLGSSVGGMDLGESELSEEDQQSLQGGNTIVAATTPRLAVLAIAAAVVVYRVERVEPSAPAATSTATQAVL